jgi:hypothetical protein
LNGSLRYSAGRGGHADVVQQQRVAVRVPPWPPWAPSVPPAPPTFSMMIGRVVQGLAQASAKSRATLSVGPPAANGTTMVMGLSG